VDGVPCLKIFLRPGQSLSYFCRFVPYFDSHFNFYRQQIALINRLEPMAVIDGTDELSTGVKFIYVPLNFSIRPQILPDRISSISHDGFCFLLSYVRTLSTHSCRCAPLVK
jgi:hypothetical protein